VPRVVVFLPHPRDNSTMPSGDKSTLHKYRGVYYLSVGSYYATALSICGPYTFRGSSNAHLAVSDDRSFGDAIQAHGRFFPWRGQWFHAWCEFVGQNNTGTVIKGKGYARWRDAWMTYTHYADNGALVDDWDFLDRHGATGVGQYNAAWPRVEAEWYMAAEGVEKVQIGADGSLEIQTLFGVKFHSSSGTIRFPNVHNVPDNAVLSIGFANLARTLPGAPWCPRAYIGKITVTDQDGSSVFATCEITAEAICVSCPFSAGRNNKTELAFSFEPEADAKTSVVVDWWSLSESALDIL
jgi:hypothetical protein